MKALFKAAVLIVFQGGAQILSHGLGSFSTALEELWPFSGKLKGPLGCGHPYGHGEAAVHGFRECLYIPVPPELRGSQPFPHGRVQPTPIPAAHLWTQTSPWRRTGRVPGVK